MENIHYFDQFSELHRKPYCRKRTVKNRTVMNWIPIFQNLLIASLIHFSACVNCPRRIYNLASCINTSQFSLLIESDWTNIFIADSKSPSCSDTNPDINKIFDWFLKNICFFQLRYSGTDQMAANDKNYLPFTNCSDFINALVSFSNFANFDKNLSNITPRID